MSSSFAGGAVPTGDFGPGFNPFNHAAFVGHIDLGGVGSQNSTFPSGRKVIFIYLEPHMNNSQFLYMVEHLCRCLIFLSQLQIFSSFAADTYDVWTMEFASMNVSFVSSFVD